MRLLLDSQALFATMFAPDDLSPAAHARVCEADMVLVSMISPYELELKKSLRKLVFPDIADWSDAIAAQGFELLPLSVAHGVAAARLPFLHRDPWDRLLVAQALAENVALVSGDHMLTRYGATVVW